MSRVNCNDFYDTLTSGGSNGINRRVVVRRVIQVNCINRCLNSKEDPSVWSSGTIQLCTDSMSRKVASRIPLSTKMTS